MREPRYLLGLLLTVACSSALPGPGNAPPQSLVFDGTVQQLMPLVDSAASRLHWEPYQRGDATRVFAVDATLAGGFRVWISIEPMTTGGVHVVTAVQASTREGYSGRQDAALRSFAESLDELVSRAQGHGQL